jgi:hypothetical protein
MRTLQKLDKYLEIYCVFACVGRMIGSVRIVFISGCLGSLSKCGVLFVKDEFGLSSVSPGSIVLSKLSSSYTMETTDSFLQSFTT